MKTYRSAARVLAVQWQPGAKHDHVRELSEPWPFDARGEPAVRGPVIAVLFSGSVLGGLNLIPVYRWDWIVMAHDAKDRPWVMSHEEFQRKYVAAA